MQKVITTWKNTGNTPVRAIDATFIFRDKNDEVLGEYEFTLFATFDSNAGVLPGETYTTPTDEGFVFPNLIDVQAASVDVNILRVLEISGI